MWQRKAYVWGMYPPNTYKCSFALLVTREILRSTSSVFVLFQNLIQFVAII